MKLKFTKMQGAGNDFIVFDGMRQDLPLDPPTVRRLADRHFGIGADQLLVVERPTAPGVDFRYRIFNADGGEVEHCGNGARCFVKFVRDQGLTDKRSIAVQVCNGTLVLTVDETGDVAVDMGAPVFEPARVPFDVDGLQGRAQAADILWPVVIADATVWLSVVSMGNPHAVQVVDDVASAPVALHGPLIESHTRFPERVNAGFMQIVDRGSIRLRVYERGAGETLACGTGACAAVVAGIRRGLLDSPVAVHTTGGRLTVSWTGGDVRLAGPAETVFNGEIDV